MSGTADHPFEWLFIMGCFAAFTFSFGTGSNDVANAFATSVGSGTYGIRKNYNCHNEKFCSFIGTLTMTQAITIAAVFEFTGGMLLGQTNVNTIAGNAMVMIP